MAAQIQRLQLKDGIVYQLGEPWPGAPKAKNKSEALMCGPIFFLPSEESPVIDDQGEVAASETRPARYEVWQVTDRTLAVFIAQFKGIEVPREELEYIAATGTVKRREFYWSNIQSVDEEWAAVLAYSKLMERFADLAAEDSEEDDDEEQQKPTVSSTDNGAQTQEAQQP